VLVCVPFFAVPFACATNKISLQVNPSQARIKQKITLTAKVATDGNPASGGTVTFFMGNVALGSIQVVGHPAQGHRQGTAVLTTILPQGKHDLTAVYGGTAQSPDVVKSKRVMLKVVGRTASAAVLAAAANPESPQNYDFTTTVSGFGFAKPGSTVDFADITSGTDLGTTALDPLTVSHGFNKGLVTVASGQPAQSVVADFNADGFPDVATANASFSISAMAVFLGKANGEFQPPVSYPTGVFTSGIVTGDFNQDGIPDVAAMSQGSGADGDVAVFLGNGDGSFQAPVDNVLGTFPVAIGMGDFDRDGVLDFATIDYFVASVYISLGNGDGTFKTPVPYGVGSGPYSVATADFNGDGFLDLAVVNDDVSTLSVLLGNGDGTFQGQKIYGTGNQVEFVATGDLNRDGKQDIIVANYAEPSVGVFLGKGDGTFKRQVSYSVGGNDAGLAIADLDGDGIPDIAASYFHPGSVGILRGNGDGTFAAVQDFKTGQTQGYQLSLADLNGDGTPDVIGDDIKSSISVLLNVTSAQAKLIDVAVPGTANDTEQIVATYNGDAKYQKSKSKPVEVHGSGAR
jgi:hypothetical protein